MVWCDVPGDELTGMLVELHDTGTRVPFLELGIDIIIILASTSFYQPPTPPQTDSNKRIPIVNTDHVLTQGWHNRRPLDASHLVRGWASSRRPSGCTGSEIPPANKIVSYPSRWSLLFIFGFLWWSSTFQQFTRFLESFLQCVPLAHWSNSGGWFRGQQILISEMSSPQREVPMQSLENS